METLCTTQELEQFKYNILGGCNSTNVILEPNLIFLEQICMYETKTRRIDKYPANFMIRLI